MKRLVDHGVDKRHYWRPPSASTARGAVGMVYGCEVPAQPQQLRPVRRRFRPQGRGDILDAEGPQRGGCGCVGEIGEAKPRDLAAARPVVGRAAANLA